MGVDARIQVYNKIHGELVAEGMSGGGVVGRFDGGRASVAPHVSGGAGAPPVQAPTMTRAATGSATGSASTDPEAEFERHVSAAMASGMSKDRAVRSVVTKNPALHARYLDSYNARHGIISNFAEDKRRTMAAG